MQIASHLYIIDGELCVRHKILRLGRQGLCGDTRALRCQPKASLLNILGNTSASVFWRVHDNFNVSSIILLGCIIMIKMILAQLTNAYGRHCITIELITFLQYPYFVMDNKYKLIQFTIHILSSLSYLVKRCQRKQTRPLEHWLDFVWLVIIHCITTKTRLRLVDQ